LRVSSPGGSAVASETVGAAVRRAKAAGIPVVVSMGDVAASGGYWIAMDADRILAAPTTLTGSIGVILAKPAVGAFLDDLGIDVDRSTRGAYAGLGSVFEPWDERELARVNGLVEELYGAFLDGVARGRGMAVADVRGVAGGRVWLGQQAAANGLVEELYGAFLDGVARGRGMAVADVRGVAGGRVWLGQQAAANGLVDEIGGFNDAVTAVRTALEVEPDAPLAVRTFPRPKRPFPAVLEAFDRVTHLTAELDALWSELAAPAELRFDAPALPVRVE
jgi:signal peptide peptidase SppA